MRVLALSPGSLQLQLERLPALAAVAEQLEAQIQVACEPAHRALWSLLPAVEKVIPFPFAGDPNLAEWTNLLGLVREPDFQACLNFAAGRQVNLMLSMSHIPVRVATEGFSSTALVSPDQGWKPQRLAAYLKPLGLSLRADAFRLTLPADVMEAARQQQPSGEGPLLLLAPDGSVDDWPDERWQSLPDRIRERLPQLRCEVMPPQAAMPQRAAAVACADVVLSSCATTQLLTAYCGVPLVAIGSSADALPERDVIRVLAGERQALSTEEVMKALGF